MNRRVIYRSATWHSKSIHRHLLNITSYFLTVISRSMLDHIGKSLFQLFSQFLTLCSKYCLICFECTNLFFRNTIFIMATITWFLQHVITFVHMIQTWNISTQVSNYTHKKSSIKTGMHSSRMRTVRSSSCLSPGGSASVHAGIPTPPDHAHTPDHAPPGTRHTPTRGQTHACENITFATSLRTVKNILGLFKYTRRHFNLCGWMLKENLVLLTSNMSARLRTDGSFELAAVLSFSIFTLEHFFPRYKMRKTFYSTRSISSFYPIIC